MMLIKQGGLRIRRGLPVLTAALLVLLFASPAQASGDDVWIPYEAGAEEPCSSPEIAPVVRIETELPPEPEPEQPLTPDGNLSLIDDITQTPSSGETPPVREFLTVQTRSGHYFYLIVDRADDGENVHFLNEVDASDLLRILDEEPEEAEAVCICQIRCQTGDVNTACPVCRLHKDECLGSVRLPEPEPAEEPVPVSEPEPEPKSSGKWKTAAAVVLLLGLGGAVVWFFLFRRGKEDVRGRFELAPYARQMEEEFALDAEPDSSAADYTPPEYDETESTDPEL